MAFYHRRLLSDEIRLLTLLPGKPKDEIQCSLQIVPLDDLPAFDALSYAWGDPNVTEAIIVENEPRQATANLVMALRALRKRKKRRLLWVDALCINQGDLDEKNIQVPLMANIYSVATHVIAWLGPSTPEIELYSEWAQTYVAKSYNISSVSWLARDAAAFFSNRLEEKNHIKRLKVYQGFWQLLGLPYWRRMWTYQEYHIARAEPVCICGNVISYSSKLVTSLDLMARLEFFSTARYLYHRETVLDEYRKVRELIPDTANVEAIAYRTWTDPSMVFLLWSTIERECSDPLDKIYSLYGLCPGIQAVYPPDYHKTLETVHRETTAYIINHEKFGEFFTSFGMRDTALDNESVPSWVLGFDQFFYSEPRNIHPAFQYYLPSDDPNDRILIRHGSSFGNFGNVSASVVDETLTILHLPARNIGSCQVTLRFGDEYDDVLDGIRRLLQADPTLLKYDAIGRLPREKVVRLCVAGHSHGIRCSDAEFLAEFERLFLVKDQGRSHQGQSDYLALNCQRAVRTLKGKTLFTTEGGLLGIGVGAINDGDILILAPEVEYPLLLRPKDRVSTDGVRGQHRLVGTAYVDGVMMPLSLDPDVDAEVSRLEVKVFDIW